MKPVFVIMVTFRRLGHFKRTLQSLIDTLPAGSKIAVVYNTEGRHEDDFAYDQYLRDITSKHDFIEVLDTGTNEGWGASINEGLHLYSDWRDFDYVLESNNDVDYEPDWALRAQELMTKYPEVGVLGLWKHVNHAVRHDKGDLVVKDDMPACAWLFRSSELAKFLPFPEKGSVKTRGGNGEDSDMAHKIQELGFWVAGPKDDLAHHTDGYDNKGGSINEAYL